MQDRILFSAPDSLKEDIDSLLSSVEYDNLFVITDTNTLPLCFERISSCKAFIAARHITIGCGDENKTIETLANIWKNLTGRGATRKSLVVNVGGGMVTDIGGFAASTFKRGIRFVNIPTTLLAMVDASTGGKTGINFLGLKNEIGVFNRPLATVISPAFLSTLPEKEFYSGYAEMIKHSLLASESDWAELVSIDEPYSMKDDFLPFIEKSVNVKCRVTEEDPFEKGLRKALNLGHTVGHAFESFAMQKGNPVPHGFAVAWGLVCELFLSTVKKEFPVEKMRQAAVYIKEHFGTFSIECKDYDALYNLMLHDKKNTQNGVNFTLLSDIGQPELDNYISKEEINEALDFYREGL